MITVTEASRKANESLNGFPEAVAAAYLAYAERRNLDDLDAVVLGVLHFYLAKKPAQPLTAFPGGTRLIEDLGCDSLTMMDTVFMVESLFELKLDDTKLAQIVTLDDLRNYLRSLSGGSAEQA